MELIIFYKLSVTRNVFDTEKNRLGKICPGSVTFRIRDLKALLSQPTDAVERRFFGRAAIPLHDRRLSCVAAFIRVPDSVKKPLAGGFCASTE